MSLHPLNQKFADAVKQLRALGVIRYDSDIARDLNHSKGNISGYLNGKVTPSEKFIRQFYEHYKVLELPENIKILQQDLPPPSPPQPTTTGDNPHTETIEYLKEIIQTQKTVIDDLKELVELYKQKPAPDLVPKKTHSKT